MAPARRRSTCPPVAWRQRCLRVVRWHLRYWQDTAPSADRFLRCRRIDGSSISPCRPLPEPPLHLRRRRIDVTGCDDDGGAAWERRNRAVANEGSALCGRGEADCGGCQAEVVEGSCSHSKNSENLASDSTFQKVAKKM